MATAKPAKKSDVPATVNDTANSTLPAFLQAKQGQPARGSENVGADDMIIPRLELIQSLSPCLDKENDAAYIEGAEAGLFFNNVTRELYGDTVQVIPVFFQKEYIIWKDRKKGGGFVGAFTTMAAAEAAMAELEDAADHRINDTVNWFCYLRHNGKLENIVVSMAVTKLKVSRQWSTLIRLTEQDSFARVYDIGSFTDQNKAGEKYKNLTVKVNGYPTEEEYLRAEQLYLMVSKGQVQVSREDDGNATVTGEKDITPGKEGTEY
ncbi:MAG: hypothetical protein E6R08_06195 [Nevskiaceae bacterium]|nr:MAG: hypothetical protein E6R08_06195 [Nevskiaceae bacterium]